MTLFSSRAGRAAFAFATAVALAAPIQPARADDGRIITVQDDLKKRADAILKSIGDSGSKVAYGGVEAGDGKDGLVIKDVEITSTEGKSVKIERIEIRDYDWENPQQPLRMDMSIKKLSVPAAALDKEVTDLGVTGLTINADMAYKLDEEKKTIDVSKIVFDVVELGELKLTFKLAGIAPSDFKDAMGGDKGEKKDAKPGDDGAMKLLAQVRLVGASISFKDKSLIERLIRADAKKKNISEAEAKKKILEELAEHRKQATDDATKEVLDLAVKFLNKPGVIELAAKPAAPVNLMAALLALMGSPGTIKEMLGLTLTVQ